MEVKYVDPNNLWGGCIFVCITVFFLWLKRYFGVDIKTTVLFRGIFFLACVYILWWKNQKALSFKSESCFKLQKCQFVGCKFHLCHLRRCLALCPTSVAILCALGYRNFLGFSCCCTCRCRLIFTFLEWNTQGKLLMVKGLHITKEHIFL